MSDELSWELIRVPELLCGSVVLKQVGVAALPEEFLRYIENRAGGPTLRLIGANALLGYRIGIDYSNHALYLDRAGSDPGPGIDVVGLILRPEWSGTYTVMGVAEFEGKPSVPDVRNGDLLITVDGISTSGETMGRVWSLLSGPPGAIRILTLQRDGKSITVRATVQRFLVAPRSSAN